MITSSSKDTSGARLTYASGGNASAARASACVTPLIRASTEHPLREISRRASNAEADTREIQLPLMATVGDVRELVSMLKRRPTGVTLVEALNSEQKRIFDPRKISAYEFWGIVNRDGERLRLTPLGLEIARQLEPEAQIYRTVLDNIVFYRSVLEWISSRELELVTHMDIAAYWQEHHPQVIDEHDEKTVEANVVCFFHLCQAAELGTMTIGKRGQPARLRVARDELFSFTHAPEASVRAGALTVNRFEDHPAANKTQTPVAGTKPLAARSSSDRFRLLISHDRRTEIVEQIRVALELADIESEVVERTATGEAAPVTEHTLCAMRQCDAAIIVVSGEDCSKGGAVSERISEDVLVEIGAAFVCYDRRVLLLWDEAVPVPLNLQNLSRCEFAGDRLTWETAVKLMRAIKGLKD